MRRFLVCAIAGAALLAANGHPAAVGAQAQVQGWPSVTSETRPWTRWWWMGSAVDAAGLTAELESLRAAGLGGVEITPIYGVAGAESRFVPYLSDGWMRLLEHTVREGGRLGMGVDMATGTGWPFGGPWVGDADASRYLTHRTWTIEGGARLTEPIRLEQAPLVRATGSQIYEVADASPAPAQTPTPPPLRGRDIRIGDLKSPVEANAHLQALALEQVRYPKPLPLAALIAYSGAGAVVDLTARVAQNGSLDWVAPEGTWTIYGVFLGWHGKLVERAAPGGEGTVIDHFSSDAIKHYLARFDRAMNGRRLTGLRAFFNDSYEVDDAQGQADGTPLLFEEFQRRRGYDLRRHLPALFGEVPAAADDVRVLADYRQTVSDLLLETFTTGWRTWAAARGARVRNQAHGSPASVLDLYAASDIPETEGTEIQRAKWATSAAHVAGRRLVAAEAATWLGEHFRTTLADVRAHVNRYFVAGVNHVVYHGTAYSPAEDSWPGWQFYASVEFNPRNAWWRDFRALNEYVTRVQSFLQVGSADHDVLLHYPLYDAFAERGTGLLAHFGGANPPARGTAFEEASATLQRRGYTYDFISDRQLAATRVDAGALRTIGGGSYKTVVLPASRFVPLETFERVLGLAREGATVVAFKDLPTAVAGLADLEARTTRFAALRAGVRFAPLDADGISEARVGRGRILRGSDLERLLARARVARETMVDEGLEFTRRRYGAGRAYFITNSTAVDQDGWVPLDDPTGDVRIFDPMTGLHGGGEVRRSAGGRLDVRLTLPRGESVIVTTGAPSGGPRFPSTSPAGPPIEVPGPWTVRFAAGGPRAPAERTIDRLASWTAFGGDDVKSFSGSAVYTTTVRRPDGDGQHWRLDLGRVHESARVRLNGRDLGTVIGPTFRVVVEAADLRPENRLEVEVTNLSANRIAALDKAGVGWRKFYNVNFPARLPENRGADGLFSAAKWEPLDSGLIGPVTLTPVR